MSALSNIEMSASFPGELEAGGGLGGHERARCAADPCSVRGSEWPTDGGIGGRGSGVDAAAGVPSAGAVAGWRWR